MIIICTEQEKQALQAVVKKFGECPGDCPIFELDCRECPLTASCDGFDSERTSFKIVDNFVI